MKCNEHVLEIHPERSPEKYFITIPQDVEISMDQEEDAQADSEFGVSARPSLDVD